MYTATLTSQGQITVPAEVRKAMRLKPGVKVVFLPQNHGSNDFRISSESGWDELGGILRKYTKIRTYPTQKEIEEAWAADYKVKMKKYEKDSR